MINLKDLYDFIDNFTSTCPFDVKNKDIEIVSKYDIIEISAILMSERMSHTYKVEYHTLDDRITVYNIKTYKNYDVHNNDSEDPCRKE